MKRFRIPGSPDRGADEPHYVSHRAFQNSQERPPFQAGIAAVVGRRRRLLDYLRGMEDARYRAIIERLGIRKYVSVQRAVSRMSHLCRQREGLSHR